MSNAEYILRSDNKNMAVWDAVNRETGRTKNKPTNNRPTEIKIDEHNFTDLYDIANIFNDYFSDVANKFLSSSPTPLTQKYNTYNNNINPASIFLTPDTEHEIQAIIQKLKNKKSSGIDEISNVTAKICAESIVTPITDICNASLVSGTFPECYKIAKVKPILKKGNTHNIEKYRPISLLSTFSKILEKVMFSRLMPFLENC